VESVYGGKAVEGVVPGCGCVAVGASSCSQPPAPEQVVFYDRQLTEHDASAAP
jgi:hypothetical protein